MRKLAMIALSGVAAGLLLASCASDDFEYVRPALKSPDVSNPQNSTSTIGVSGANGVMMGQ